jgi:two-component sensor histidine kinase
MIRSLVSRLGIVKSVLVLTITSVLLSACLYTAFSTLFDSFDTTGIVMSIIAPAIVAPLVSYPPMRVLVRLEIAERELAEANSQLEQRVQQRTAELVRANEELQAEVAERILAEGQATASLREKDVLLREVHHRVKNNLQLVSSLLYLQSRETQDSRVLKMFQESQARIRSMALVHERLYQSSSMASIDFGEYTQRLVDDLFHSYGISDDQIVSRIDMDNTTLSVDTAIHCGLVINELISNSLKHAFPGNRKGKVYIELCSDELGCTLTVGDNGIGLPPDTARQRDQSLGLQLVSTLVQQLGGDIKVDTGPGTTFRITFSLPGAE